LQFAGTGASNHLPEGNNYRRGDHHLGDTVLSNRQSGQYADAYGMCNAEARMTAMQRRNL
jgi:hypothetical protein